MANVVELAPVTVTLMIMIATSRWRVRRAVARRMREDR